MCWSGCSFCHQNRRILIARVQEARDFIHKWLCSTKIMRFLHFATEFVNPTLNSSEFVDLVVRSAIRFESSIRFSKFQTVFTFGFEFRISKMWIHLTSFKAFCWTRKLDKNPNFNRTSSGKLQIHSQMTVSLTKNMEFVRIATGSVNLIMNLRDFE